VRLTLPARRDKMVEMVESMRMTASSSQLTAYGLGRMRRQKYAGAVSRKPMRGVAQRRTAALTEWSNKTAVNGRANEQCGPHQALCPD
jgi:hypothetical protein